MLYSCYLYLFAYIGVQHGFHITYHSFNNYWCYFWIRNCFPSGAPKFNQVCRAVRVALSFIFLFNVFYVLSFDWRHLIVPMIFLTLSYRMSYAHCWRPYCDFKMFNVKNKTKHQKTLLSYFNLIQHITLDCPSCSFTSISFVSLHSEFRIVMSCTLSASHRCLVCHYYHLLVGGIMSYARDLCFFFGHSGVQHISCCVFYLFIFVLCTLCCQFLWIVHFWLLLRLVYLMLPVSLDCPLLIAPSVFSKIYLLTMWSW